MIGTVLLLVAGWYRSKLWAAVTILASFGLQVGIALPSINENRRLMGLPQTDLAGTAAYILIQCIVVGLIFYFIGFGARWLWDKRKREPQS